MTYTEIGSAGELRELLGSPGERALTKERTRLHAMDREWLALSPFCVLATSDEHGHCDASPKGDPALPSHAAMVKAVQDTPETLEELEEHYAPANYAKLLY